MAKSIRSSSNEMPHCTHSSQLAMDPTIRTKVTEELVYMKVMEVISKVDQPTPWCPGTVVVPERVSIYLHLCGLQTT